MIIFELNSTLYRKGAKTIFVLAGRLTTNQDGLQGTPFLLLLLQQEEFSSLLFLRLFESRSCLKGLEVFSQHFWVFGEHDFLTNEEFIFELIGAGVLEFDEEGKLAVS